MTRWTAIRTSIIALGAATGIIAVAAGVGAQATKTMAVRSERPGIMFAATGQLPANAASATKDDLCDHYRITTRSPGAALAGQSGWTVTSEAKLGSYDVVSLAGRLAPATSGVCQVQDGRIAVYRGTQLIALAQSENPAKLSLGSLEPRAADTLLIGDGEGPVSPVAILRSDAAGALVLAPLPPRELVCGGKASLPNIYDKPIYEARRALIADGWKPVAQRGPRNGEGIENDLRVRGVTEVESCSGTGYGFCGFAYVGPAGTLSVTTIGETPSDAVVGYQAKCNTDAAR